MRGLNQAPRRLVRAVSPAPPVLCDRGSPSPRPSAPHLETSGRPNGRSGDPRRTKQIATKEVGIRGRSRPTLQHATLVLPAPLAKLPSDVPPPPEGTQATTSGGGLLTHPPGRLDPAAVPGRVAPGDCSPGAPTDPYVPFQAYGSSHHERATGRHTEWIAT